jgi:hypothetical protein
MLTITNVIGNRTQSRICGSRYNETLHILYVRKTVNNIIAFTHAELDIVVGRKFWNTYPKFGSKQSNAASDEHFAFDCPGDYRLFWTYRGNIRITMDNSPTALFDSYEQDFQQIVDSLKEKLEADTKDERTGEAQQQLIIWVAMLICDIFW